MLCMEIIIFYMHCKHIGIVTCTTDGIGWFCIYKIIFCFVSPSKQPTMCLDVVGSVLYVMQRAIAVLKGLKCTSYQLHR